MNFDFENDILEWSNNVISKLGYIPCSENTATKRLSHVFNYLRHKIPPIPRSIKIANNFSCPENYVNGYEQTILEIKTGQDLMPRCSRQQREESGHFDRMLFDWNIYHLHLGTEKIQQGKNKGLIQGHKDILFIYITDKIAYIIGIFGHGSWTKQEVLETVHCNWPELLDLYKLEGEVNLTREVTEHDRGITNAGTGSNEIDKALIVMRAIDDLKEWINSNSNLVMKSLRSKDELIKLDVSRYILTKTFSVFSSESQVRIFIPSKDHLNSLIHPALVNSVEPDEGSYEYYTPGSFSGILVHDLKNT